ncbi:MAG: hypothetical protein GY749_08100 [Desulfobacteraceae bacterium]|nr:hypothetical protein [Desulfobacteraceae bacterium]
MSAWIQVFRTGNHTDSAGNKKKYNREDLLEITKKYNTQAEYEAPLVIGHPQTDDPAYGWIKSLKVAGEKLYAEIDAISEHVRNLVQKKMYKYVSIALYPDRLLRHVGLLGAAPPAVRGMEAVKFCEFSNEQYEEYEEYNMPDEKKNTVSNDRWKEEMQDQMNDLGKKLNAMSEFNNILRTENTELRMELAGTKFAAELETLIRDGKVLTAERDSLIADHNDLFAAQAGNEYAEGESLTERQLKRLQARPVINELRHEEFAVNPGKINLTVSMGFGDKMVDQKSVEIDQQASEYMDKHGCDYETAVMKVMPG